VLILITGENKETAENIGLLFCMCFPSADILTADPGNAFMEIVREKNPDLIIIGPNLSYPDRLNTIKQIRRSCSIPVIAIFHLEKETPILQTLEAGASMCFGENISQLEFIARARALMRSYENDRLNYKKITGKNTHTQVDSLHKNSGTWL
jgi:DNA-binding response OmpR family regulator